MKVTYYGTSASEGWPALFCSCRACQQARAYGGKNIRTRSQALIDSSLLIDFPPDTNYHVQVYGLNLAKVQTLLITHSHHDHFFPQDIAMRISGFAEGTNEKKLIVYGNETVEQSFYHACASFEKLADFVLFRRLDPFDTIFTEDGYQVTTLLADHNWPEKSLLYSISRNNKSLLYAHDTGIFPEETWRFLEGRQFDFVSLDCTALSRNWREGHMGFQAVEEVRRRMEEIHCIAPHTCLVLNHFAHYGEFTHDKLCALMNPKGYAVAYDGCSFTF